MPPNVLELKVCACSTEQYDQWLIHITPGGRRQWRQPLNPAAMAKPLAQRCQTTICHKGGEAPQLPFAAGTLELTSPKPCYLRHFRPNM